MDDKLLLTWNFPYLQQICVWQSWRTESVSKLLRIEGFKSYNRIIDINTVFAQTPMFMPVDRTGHVKMPFRYKITRPWKIPTQQWSLEKSMEQRVINLLSSGKKINLMWSGGIDSTALVTAFLKHAPDHGQLRVLYSPWSTYEHPEYLEFLKKFRRVETIDISGTVYLTQQFDGICVSGDGGDELMASIDESFLDQHGMDVLNCPWQDLFRQFVPDDDFIEFCTNFFAVSGRPIETVLHARWWFYSSCKLTSLLYEKIPLIFDQRQQFNVNEWVGFYNCEEFENYIYWNIEHCITGPNYENHKQVLKDYACKFDGFEQWRNNKCKMGSIQTQIYANKKVALQNRYWIALLEDGTRISTPSLPILTRKEFDQRYNLNYLFNTPDEVSN